MRVGKTLQGLLVTSLLVTGPAFASSEVEKELAEMRELVEGLEQRVEAQEEQIEHQSGLLEDAQQVVRDQQQEDGTQSGMAEFWQSIDVNMSVATSYAYNVDKPTDSDLSGVFANSGNSGHFYPFHPDHNSFQVDQVWVDIGKQATDESRAGFQFSMLYGNTAGFLGQGGFYEPVGLNEGPHRVFATDSTSDLYVHQAYVTYLAPLGEGLRFDAGKFATITGAEVADASKNWNITRGNLYTLLQPIDHLGLLSSTSIGPVTLKAGVVNQNDFRTSSPDINSEKSYLGQVAIGNDMFSLANTVLYGADGLSGSTINGRRTGLYDMVAAFNGDAFSAWVNADYAWIEGRAPAAWGVALAGQVPLTEVLYAALRLEYLRDKTSDSGSDFFGIGTGVHHSEIYGATGTLAYELAENLTLKGEVRYDRVNENLVGGTSFGEFVSNTSGGDNDQVVGLAQVIYAF